MKSIGIYPNDDHLVFVNKSETELFERKATIVYQSETENDEGTFDYNALYIDELGKVRKDWIYLDQTKPDEHYILIGRKGDTITPKALEKVMTIAIKYMDCGISTILERASNYFKLDVENAEDVLKLRLHHVRDNIVYLKTDSSYFSFGEDLCFNLKNKEKDYKIQEKDKIITLYSGHEKPGIRDDIALPLYEYAKLLGRDEIKIDLDFEWSSYSEQTNEKNNKEIQELRKKYIPELKRYISDCISEIKEDDIK